MWCFCWYGWWLGVVRGFVRLWGGDTGGGGGGLVGGGTFRTGVIVGVGGACFDLSICDGLGRLLLCGVLVLINPGCCCCWNCPKKKRRNAI